MLTIDAIIVDDDKNICETFKEYLKAMGVVRHVIIANDGVTAMNKLNNQKFGLILLDLELPKRDGAQIVQLLKESDPDALTRVIIVSGKIDKNTMTTAIQNGVKNFLVKPFGEAEFKQKVALVLKNAKGNA